MQQLTREMKYNCSYTLLQM